MLITPIIILSLVACSNNADNINNDNNKDLNKDLNISSMSTSMSSKDYPHTQALLTQRAKYEFIPIEPGEEYQFQVEVPDINYGQVPNQWQDQLGFPPMSQQEPQWQDRQAAPPPNYQQAPTQQERQGAKAPTQQPTTEQAPAPKPAPAPTPETKAKPAPKQPEKKQTTGITQSAQQVIDLTNAERRKQGLPDLQADTQLSGVAQKKSEDMQQKHYFSHTSPTYGSPFDMMRDFGVTYKSAGENIAQGQQTPQEVVQAWMNSEGHRKNILSKDFTHIGVGYEQTGKHWTQMFIGK
ncbi:CAP domain-containing protein [Lederbergia wuyishanensis]|uniref:YkwD family protein n=1 Tax=Lederbergia wuyishanensis TaxID=1347903 RepID=A0ABU0D4E8_9BACI|nr:CAP domain-containing protein [Lederbergia wuyishanensis]MCJ8008140.1 CAP domain-containing protein [Lederbergia wuyishanensis]MDQ0343274.1 putative YkwD family protein [Lederbergia wuyishanensis]